METKALKWDLKERSRKDNREFILVNDIFLMSYRLVSNIKNGFRFINNGVNNSISSVKKPTYAYITLTSSCNSKCKYCMMWNLPKQKELSTKEWKKIIKDLPKIGVVALTFSGGEPFLRKDLFELAQYAKGCGLMTLVVTNLSLFKEIHVKEIAKSFDFFGISIDSTKPEVYRKLRGVDWLESNKNKIRNLMKGLAEIKSEIQVCCMVTVSKKNADEMHEIIHMVFDDLHMDTMSFNIVDPNGSKDAKKLVPTGEQLERFRDVVLEHKKTYPISNSKRYFNSLGSFDYRCNSWKCFQIDAEGFLRLPCLFIEKKKVNLLENDIVDLWRSADYQKTHSEYSKCKACNLGCVAETAWSTYDINFIINEGLFGMMIPTLNRIIERNKNFINGSS